MWTLTEGARFDLANGIAVAAHQQVQPLASHDVWVHILDDTIWCHLQLHHTHGLLLWAQVRAQGHQAQGFTTVVCYGKNVACVVYHMCDPCLCMRILQLSPVLLEHG